MSSPGDTPDPAASAAAAAASAEASAIMHAIKHKGEHQYPIDIWYFLASTVGVAAVLNVASVIWAFWRRQEVRRGTTSGIVSGKAQTNGIFTRLAYAAVAASRIVAFRWRVPTIRLSILEALLTAIYLMALLIWLLANTQQLTITDYSDRAGHIAGSQIPLIVGLSMKNNIIGYLIGVGHEKLHVLHRSFARSLFVIVLVHGFSRVTVDHVQMVEFGWTRLGLACGIIYAIIILMSFAPIRRRFFEIFYMFHVVLVFALILIAYLHSAASNFGYYVWPAFVVWGFDRVCRYMRYLILMDFHSPFNSSSQATIELLSADTIRMTARRGATLPITWSAGQHMYLALPSLGPVESHPFTIATIPNDDSPNDSSARERKGKEMVWIIRARDGFTKRMRDYVTGLGGKCQVPIFMHGPYGIPADITPFSTCVFVAGGSGVTYTLPRMRDLLLRVSKSQACAQRIFFIWAIRHASHLEWLSSEFTKALSMVRENPSVSFVIKIYITSSVSGNSLSLSSDDMEKDVETPTSIGEKQVTAFGDSELVEVKYGRPNVATIIEHVVHGSDGPVSVDVSGPKLLLQDVRGALSGGFASPLNILRGGPFVQLNVETFAM
ncbi:ferric reductase NAD binding domain-containing protein [Irpex rosettiformis]|uniref:Ferric reductase NAD binding domain-containing protein n=1 Tax=Irpex rosettiformis TaxID=378272 RepID=A0ACB8UCK6_9APHY|nr:ferric reductase NAD binding domain-containing protein [Irpex rosettiformis]